MAYIALLLMFAGEKLWRGIFRIRVVRARVHVALEGIDGCGKSTVAGIVEGELRASSVSWSFVQYTDKANVVGRLIRRLYGDSNGATSFAADLFRRQRWIQALLYAVNGRINLRRVNCDSELIFADRSVVCSYASHKDLVPIWFLNIIESRSVPDLVIYMDVEPSVADARLRSRGSRGYEEDLAALELFREQYELVFADRPRRLERVEVIRLPAQDGVVQVAAAVRDIISKELERRGVSC